MTSWAFLTWIVFRKLGRNWVKLWCSKVGKYGSHEEGHLLIRELLNPEIYFGLTGMEYFTTKVATSQPPPMIHKARSICSLKKVLLVLKWPVTFSFNNISYTQWSWTVFGLAQRCDTYFWRPKSDLNGG